MASDEENEVHVSDFALSGDDEQEEHDLDDDDGGEIDDDDDDDHDEPNRDPVSQEEIIRNYTTPGHPTAYAGVTKVQRYYRGQGVTLEDVRRALEHVDAYTLHKEYKRPRLRNPYYVHFKRQQVQADLIHVDDLAERNDGVRYLLALIDAFTRKLWVLPLPNKSGRTVREAFKQWLFVIEQPPRSIFFDRGKEFVNRWVTGLLRGRGIRTLFPKSDIKAGTVERVNRSIQNLLYKYLSDRETFRYLEVLPDLVATYNDRPHRSLDGLTPNQAEAPQNTLLVRDLHRRRYDRLERRRAAKLRSARRHSRPATRIQVGDTVRIKTLRGAFDRGYHTQFKGELFRVERIFTNMTVPMYQLRSQNDGELVEGGFYANELSLVRHDDVYRVERILRRRRTPEGRLQYLVRWRDFGPQHDSWIDARNIVDDFDL